MPDPAWLHAPTVEWCADRIDAIAARSVNRRWTAFGALGRASRHLRQIVRRAALPAPTSIPTTLDQVRDFARRGANAQSAVDQTLGKRDA